MAHVARFRGSKLLHSGFAAPWRFEESQNFLVRLQGLDSGGLSIAIKGSGLNTAGDSGIPETPAAAASAIENEQVLRTCAQHPEACLHSVNRACTQMMQGVALMAGALACPYCAAVAKIPADNSMHA